MLARVSRTTAGRLKLVATAIMVLGLALSPILPPFAYTAYAANDLVIVESGGATSVNESGSTDTLTLALSDAPTSNVVLSLTSNDTSEATVSPSDVTFTPGNWNVPQTITVTGVDDAAADGNQLSNVVISVVDSLSPAAYAGKTATVSVTTVDNEPSASAGLTVTQSGGTTGVSESGTTDTFTVVLNKQPTSAVSIAVTSGDTSEATVSPGSLTFTPSNWSTPQTVMVTGVDDATADGDKVSTVVISVVDGVSADEYDTVADQAVSVTTLDNEAVVPAFTVTQSGGTSSVNESGTSDTFTVVLRKEPTSNVVISVTSGDTSEATVSPASLTFTAGNWSTPQTVTATGVDDATADGDQTTAVVLSIVDALSADEYDTVADQTVSVTTVDNEPPAAGLTVTQSGGTTTVSESGTTDTFTVMLNRAPTSNVVVAATSTDTSEASISPSSLTFTPSNWSTPQTVTVTGVDDSTNDGNQVTPVVLSIVDALSADEYDTVADQTVSVTTVDNDPVVRIAPVPVGPQSGTKLSNLGPLLQWTQEPGTVWFQIQVIPFNGDGPGINLVIGDPAMVAAARYQVQEPNFGAADPNYVMLPDLTYTWRVRTALTAAPPAEADWTSWSASLSFETANKSSSTIGLAGPAIGATVSSLMPTLSWTNADLTIFYYEVQLSKDQTFTLDPALASAAVFWELIHGGVTTPRDSYSVRSQYPLESGETYFWRVRPRIQGDGDPVPWGPTWSFMTP